MFGNNQKLQTCQGIKLEIGDEELESTDSIKYLGVAIHDSMIWHEHIESLIAKLNQRIGLLRRIKHLLKSEAQITLYKDFYTYAQNNGIF